jgi:hypothetical protein
VAVSTNIEVVGLKEALRDLNNLDKKARRDITKRFKEVVDPVIKEIQSNFPTNAPLSGFQRAWNPARGRSASAALARRDAFAAVLAEQRNRSGANAILPWNYDKKAVVANVSGKRPRSRTGRSGPYTSNLAVFRIIWKGPGARLFDTAGRGDPRTQQGKRMAAALTAKFGKPSRLMWPSYEKERDRVEAAVRRIINDVMEQTNRDIRV